jgi:hypothetical protein
LRMRSPRQTQRKTHGGDRNSAKDDKSHAV